MRCESVSLEEAPEFGPRALEALRQPLEQGAVSLRRSQGQTDFPARVQLVLAANPCRCARPSGDLACECAPLARRRYLGRLSGPLLDRIDVHVTLSAVKTSELLDELATCEPSAVVAARVAAARAAATARWGPHGPWRSNAEVPGTVLRSPRWRLPGRALRRVRQMLDCGSLSARGFDRVLRLAWTIADLDGRVCPEEGDVNEATGLRTGETPS